MIETSCTLLWGKLGRGNTHSTQAEVAYGVLKGSELYQNLSFKHDKLESMCKQDHEACVRQQCVHVYSLCQWTKKCVNIEVKQLSAEH